MTNEELRDQVKKLMQEGYMSRDIAKDLRISAQKAAAIMRTIGTSEMENESAQARDEREEKERKEKARHFSFDLKRCPFCGGAADLEMTFSNTGVNISIMCEDCSASVPGTNYLGVRADVSILQGAVDRWNKRFYDMSFFREEGEGND